MIQPATRMNDLTASVFSELAAKKAEKATQGHDIIDLSIGSPDLPPPQEIRDSLAENAREEGQYGYTLKGTSDFQEAVCHYYKERFGVSILPDEVLQLMGSQDGLAHLALAYLDPGDIIIAPDPGYPIYSACARLAGADLYTVPVNEDNNFMPDLSLIPLDILRRAKMMIFNYPGNPTAALATKEYFKEMISFGLKHNILIVHDFAYSELIFDNNEPISIFHIPDAKKIAVEFNSLSKSFNMAGARIGYLIGYPSLLKPLASLKSHIDYGVFLPIQNAAIKALTSDYSFLQAHKETYQARRDVLFDSLTENGWNVRKPDGGMFIWAMIPPHYTSLSFSLEAIEQGVVVTPGNAFGMGGEGYVRIALVQSDERLREAGLRLTSLI
ncbi:LL-diaminopimelate aminotransferase [Bacillus sp. FJAT-44742]|uniref:LL-diaminopimelate aminotransferase n=1 Tax=Bacillus sp. FJAT-44742 TaxID=2014005 RepID=UPI000C23B3C2|nr:LL-diaminopimelate aminotransferase [Bacillus sp. FJAT-44742]